MSFNNQKKPSTSIAVQKFLQKASSEFSELTAVGFNKTFICCKDSCIENPTSFYGSFYLGPFPESLALTLSHNIRRTLLSEIPGLAITAVEIDGVLHKYSNLPGIKETVVDILANIQNIVLVKTRLANSFIAFLKVRGPGFVKASDMRLPAGVELVNPDQHIATLAEDGVLNIKFWIHEGKHSIKQTPKTPDNVSTKPSSTDSFTSFNSFTTEPHNLTQQSWGGSVASVDYTSADFETGLSQEQQGSNKIYLDAVFMPVTKVNAFVETNFKATDDPVKNGPFIFPTAQLTYPQKGTLFHKSAVKQSSPGLLRPNVSQKSLFAKKAQQTKSNYFNFVPESSEHLSTNYLQLNYLANSIEIQNKKSQTLNSALKTTQPYQNISLLDPAGLISFQKSFSTSGMHESINPIVLAPLTFNKPTKQCHIVLEIWTNGSIHPRQALKECLDFLAKTLISLNNVKILGSMYKSHMTYKKILQNSKTSASYKTKTLNTSEKAT